MCIFIKIQHTDTNYRELYLMNYLTRIKYTIQDRC